MKNQAKNFHCIDNVLTRKNPCRFQCHDCKTYESGQWEKPYLRWMGIFITLIIGSIIFFSTCSCSPVDQEIMKQDKRLLPYIQVIEDHLSNRGVTPDLTRQLNLIIKDLGVENDFMLNPNSGAPWGRYEFNTIWIDQTVYNTFVANEMFNELELLIIHEVTHFYWFEHFEVDYTLKPLREIGNDFNEDQLNNVYDLFASDILRKYPEARIVQKSQIMEGHLIFGFIVFASALIGINNSQHRFLRSR